MWALRGASSTTMDLDVAPLPLPGANLMATPRAARRLPRTGSGTVPLRIVVALGLVLVAAGTTWFTGATFTASSTTVSTVSAAADFYPPTVTVASPGAVVTGTVEVTATATDSASAVTGVTIEYAASGSAAWTALCTDGTAPYTCAWDTTKVADGDHQLRATATDAAGFTGTSAVVSTRVANAASVELKEVADNSRGTISLTAAVTGAAGRTVTSAFQYRPTGTTTWTTVGGCGAVAGTDPTCSWATGTLAGDHDVQVVSTVGTVQATDVQTAVTIDNLAPTVTPTIASPLRGTVTLTASITEAHSGVGSVVYSYRTTSLLGNGPWVQACTADRAPYSCTLNTSDMANGTYEFRVVATDIAGNSTTATQANRMVDNTQASVVVTSPTAGAVRGTIIVSADANAGGLGTATGVALEYSRNGTDWTPICSDPTAPYSCSWNTTAVPSGAYQVRAVLNYRTAALLDRQLVSQPVAVYVDNTRLTAAAVRLTTSTGTAGRLNGGDTLTFEWSTLVDPTTVLTGWNGSSTTVGVTVVGAKGNSNTEVVTVGGTNIGTVSLTNTYVGNNVTTTLTSTMTATTVQGVDGLFTRVMITLGAPSGAVNSGVGTGTATWTPSSMVATPGGTASTTGPATGTAAW